MAKLKQEKLAVQIQKFITDIIQFELKTNDLGIVTVTRVKVSDDNSWAKIYVSFLDKNREEKLDKLKEYKTPIRTALAKKLTIRRTPDLTFTLDDSYEKGEKIEKIIRELNNK